MGVTRGAEAFAGAVDHDETPLFTGEDGLRSAQGDSRSPLLPLADSLVTGAAGFLGRAVVAALRARGLTVRALVRRPVAAFNDDDGIQQVIGDLGDPQIVEHAVAGADVVYHVGAATHGSHRDYEVGTVWGTRNVLDACRKHDSHRLVYVSSMSVYDHAGRRDSEELREDYRFEPHPQLRGAYTQTKLKADRMVAAAIAAGLPAVILRPGQIFGPGAEHVTPGGTVALAGVWLAIGSGRMPLPLIYRDDVVDAMLLAGQSSQALGGVFNLVDPDSVDRDEYLRRCKASLGSTLKLLRVPIWMFMSLAFGVELIGKLLKRDMPLTRYRVLSLRPLGNFDASAARDTLGWTPRVGVRRGLDITFGTTPSARVSMPTGQ